MKKLSQEFSEFIDKEVQSQMMTKIQVKNLFKKFLLANVGVYSIDSSFSMLGTLSPEYEKSTLSNAKKALRESLSSEISERVRIEELPVSDPHVRVVRQSVKVILLGDENE